MGEDDEVKGEGSESSEGNIDTLSKNNDIQNIVKKFDGVPKMPSPPSSVHSCPYCEIL